MIQASETMKRPVISSMITCSKEPIRCGGGRNRTAALMNENDLTKMVCFPKCSNKDPFLSIDHPVGGSDKNEL